MFLRMLRKSFTTGLKGKILAIITVAFGASLATAMLTVSLDIGDKINRELKTYGANLLVEPKMDTIPVEIGGVDFNPLADKAYIKEEDLPKLKMIFWRHNIVGFAPYLYQTAITGTKGREIQLVGTWFNKRLVIPTGETVNTGVQQVKPWWEVEGEWLDDEDGENGALVGAALAGQLAIQPGDTLTVRLPSASGEMQVDLPVRGVLHGGGEEDTKIFVRLDYLQEITGLEGRVAKVEVSALTTPENELARKAQANPEALTAEEFERWYCTAYVSAIAYQIEEVIPGVQAKAIRQVAQSEGLILGKIQFLMFLLTLVALVSAGLGISNLMTTKVLERSKEIGLLKALGAADYSVVLLFLVEAAVTGLVGGALGYGIGMAFAQFIGQRVFDTSLAFKALVIPLVLLLSIGITFFGSLSAMRMVIKLRPAEVLHGR